MHAWLAQLDAAPKQWIDTRQGGRPLGVDFDIAGYLAKAVPGETWQELKYRIADGAVRWSDERRWRCVLDLILAAAMLEQAQFVHGDLSPNNVIIDVNAPDRLPGLYVIDFDAYVATPGNRKLILPLEDGGTYGTEGYCPPDLSRRAAQNATGLAPYSDRHARDMLLMELLLMSADLSPDAPPAQWELKELEQQFEKMHKKVKPENQWLTAKLNPQQLFTLPEPIRPSSRELARKLGLSLPPAPGVKTAAKLWSPPPPKVTPLPAPKPTPVYAPPPPPPPPITTTSAPLPSLSDPIDTPKAVLAILIALGAIAAVLWTLHATRDKWEWPIDQLTYWAVTQGNHRLAGMDGAFWGGLWDLFVAGAILGGCAFFWISLFIAPILSCLEIAEGGPAYGWPFVAGLVALILAVIAPFIGIIVGMFLGIIFVPLIGGVILLFFGPDWIPFMYPTLFQAIVLLVGYGICNMVVEDNGFDFAGSNVLPGAAVLAAGFLTNYLLFAGREPVQVIAAHQGRVTQLAVTSDGKHLVSAGEDHTLRVTRAADGVLVHKIELKGFEATCLKATPDGKKIVAGCSDGIVRRWNLEDGAPLANVATVKPIHALAVSPDGALLVVASDKQTVQLFKLETAEMLKTLNAAGEGTITDVAFDRAGKSVAAALRESKSIQIWNVETGEIRHAFQTDVHSKFKAWWRGWWNADEPANEPTTPRLVVFSPISDVVAIGGTRWGDVHLRNSADGKHLRRLQLHEGEVGGLAFSPDGKLVASAGAKDQGILLEYVASGTLFGKLEAEAAKVTRIVFIPREAGHYVVAAGFDDGKIRVFNGPLLRWTP